MNNKEHIYQNILSLVPKLFESHELISKMAIFNAIYKKEFSNILFVGFYLLKNNKLFIGPYQGNTIACSPIDIGKGVCGESILENKTIIVNDVRKRKNYISCDPNTVSELVIPLSKKSNLIGVLDIDSSKKNYFTDTDTKYLNKLLNEISK